MSIRVQCEKCGSVLKIKDELAGTKGKCPKCKAVFLVPQPGETEPAGVPAAGAEAASSSVEGEAAEAPAAVRPSPPRPAKPAPRVETPASEEEEIPAAHNNGSSLGDVDQSTDHEIPVVKDPPPAAPPPAPKAPPNAAADDFDPAEFLMAEGGPKPKPAPQQPPRPEPPGARRPSSMGRRLEMSDDETEVPGPQQETKTPPPRGSCGRSAAEMAGAMLTSGAATANSAKELLARSAQDSRSRSAQMPDEASEARVDYVALAREIFRSFGLYILGTILLCIGLYWFMSRMLGDAVPLPPKLARVTGTVTLGGKPLPNVRVYFTPILTEQNPKLRPRDSMGLTNENGEFDLLYLPEEGIYGAVVGKNRVWLEATTPEQFKLIPPSYQSANSSADIKDIKEVGGDIRIDL